jgi:hypothetical protein
MPMPLVVNGGLTAAQMAALRNAPPMPVEWYPTIAQTVAGREAAIAEAFELAKIAGACWECGETEGHTKECSQ